MANKAQLKQIDECKKEFGIIGRVVGVMEISELKRALTPEENVQALVYGIDNGSFVFMAATDQRVYFIDKRLMNSRIDSYHYSHIESINYDLGVVAGMVSLVAAGGTIELRFAPNNLIRRFVRVTQERIQQRNTAKIAPSVDNSGIVKDLEILERLAKLYKDGALTTEEYEIEKAKVIG